MAELKLSKKEIIEKLIEYQLGDEAQQKRNRKSWKLIRLESEKNLEGLLKVKWDKKL